MKKQVGFSLMGALLIIGVLAVTAGGVLVWEKKALSLPTPTSIPQIPPVTLPEKPTDGCSELGDKDCLANPDCFPVYGPSCPVCTNEVFKRCRERQSGDIKRMPSGATSFCESAGGVYKTFPTTCADSCEFARKGYDIFCGEALTDSCDCGPDRCWNGIFCELN